MLGATLAHDAYLDRLKQELDRVSHDELKHWADLVYSALPGVRRLTLGHLALALGDTHSAAARRAIARAAYRNTARLAVELAKLEDIRPQFDEYVSTEG